MERGCKKYILKDRNNNDRKGLLRKKNEKNEKKKRKRIPILATCNGKLTMISKVIYRYWNVLQSIQSYKKIPMESDCGKRQKPTRNCRRSDGPQQLFI